MPSSVPSRYARAISRNAGKKRSMISRTLTPLFSYKRTARANHKLASTEFHMLSASDVPKMFGMSPRLSQRVAEYSA
jgi:hypothetical protein